MEKRAPAQWTRETSWRQGHVFPPAAAAYFGLTNSVDPVATRVVVISHDCDLAIDNLTIEPEAEVIVGRSVPKEDGNYSWGKAPRTLHYETTQSRTTTVLELTATSKRRVLKSELARFEPDLAFAMDGQALSILRSWLGARYNRAAFPDSFVKRMRTTEADNRLAKALSGYGKLISFVYFNVDGGRNLEREVGDSYELSIVLVFAPGQDPEASSETAAAAAAAVATAVGARLKDSEAIVLKSCFAISEDDVPVSRARLLTQWRLEYMTLKADDMQPGPPAV